MNRNRRIQWFRWVIRLAALLLLPGLFSLTFLQARRVYTTLTADGFSVSAHWVSHVELLVLLLATLLLGRFFCGWLCAFGTCHDLLYAATGRRSRPRRTPPPALDRILKYVKYLVLLLIVLFYWTWGGQALSAADPWAAFGQLPRLLAAFPTYRAGLILLAAIALGALLIERCFCRYLCPLGALLAIVSLPRFMKVNPCCSARENCGQCTRACPMGINLSAGEVVSSGECIQCFQCLNACRRNRIGVRLGGAQRGPLTALLVAVLVTAGLYAGATAWARRIAGATAAAPPETEAAALSPARYSDGVHIGVGQGYRPELRVSVRIAQGRIVAIEVLSHNETPSFTREPFRVLPERLIAAQHTEVEAISGATATSAGLLAAVQDALEQATAQDPD